jgi:hypothetical protein
MWGRAVDMTARLEYNKDKSGKIDSTPNQNAKEPALAYFQRAASEAQKWVTTYGYKWSWYPYTAEVWHVYDNSTKSAGNLLGAKLI